MKKILFTILMFGGIFSFSFKTAIVHNSARSYSHRKFGEWGPWKTTSCYKGLDFRVRRTQEDSFNNDKYEWEVQFRNRYADVINFNFKITYPGDESEPFDRQSINANATTNGKDWALVQASSSCEVLVSKVRFGDDDGSKPYIACGN